MRNECLEQVITCPWPHILRMVKQGQTPETPTPGPLFHPRPLRGSGAGKFLGALESWSWVSPPRPYSCGSLSHLGLVLRWRMVGISFSSLSLLCLSLGIGSNTVLLLWQKIDKDWRYQVGFCDFLLSYQWEYDTLLFSFSQRCRGY